jgi:hypothetical protein
MSLLASLLVLVASATPALARDTSTHLYSFERTFSGWTRDHFIACEQEDPPCQFDWRVTRSMDRAKHGDFSLKARLDGTNDDGTIWLEKRFTGRPGSLTAVQISFWLWSPVQADINTWPVVAFAGAANPETEDDFAIIGQTDQARGWTRYSYLSNVRVGASGDVWVAFGFGATWESERTHYMDLVRVAGLR